MDGDGSSCAECSDRTPSKRGLKLKSSQPCCYYKAQFRMTCQGAVRIINASLTFSGKLRCGRLLPESQLSRSCRVPSSRSRQQRWSAREAAQSTANFSCTARTRSAVGAIPLRPEKKKRAEMSFQLSLPGYKTHTEADSGQRKRAGEKSVRQHRVGWRGRASYLPK